MKNLSVCHIPFQPKGLKVILAVFCATNCKAGSNMLEIVFALQPQRSKCHVYKAAAFSQTGLAKRVLCLMTLCNQVCL